MHFTAPIFVLTSLLLPAMTVAAGLETEYVYTPEKCTRKTVKGDKIEVHYRGTLASDGSEFDASYNRGTPLSFEVGSGRVIKGLASMLFSREYRQSIEQYLWDEGLIDMCVGEKRKLTIPPELGYGQRAMGPIPAGSTLIFETELVSIAGQKDEL